MVYGLPYSDVVFLVLALSPLCALLLCASGSRKDQQSQQKTSPETNTAPTSSASHISLRFSSRADSTKPSSSPEMVTPSPLPPPLPIPDTVVSQYVPTIPQTRTKGSAAPKGRPEPLPPIAVADPVKKSTLASLDSYNDVTGRTYETYAMRDQAPPGVPLVPIASDPLDRSYEAPVRKQSARAPEIKKGKRADPADQKYQTNEDDYTDFSENPFVSSARTKKSERKTRKEAKAESKTKKKTNKVHKVEKVEKKEKIEKVKLVLPPTQPSSTNRISSTQRSKSQAV